MISLIVSNEILNKLHHFICIVFIDREIGKHWYTGQVAVVVYVSGTRYW